MEGPAGIEPPPERRVAPGQWDGAVAALDGPQIVVGGPGTGKTEFLVRRAAAILARPDLQPRSLLVLSFGRRGVADLRERIRSRVGSLGDLDVATFHSFASRLMEVYGGSNGWPADTQILTGPEQQAMVEELLATDDPAAWSPAFRGMLETRTFAQEVTDFILRGSEQLLAPRDVAAMERADWRGLPEFMERYNAALRARHRIDYGTLLRESTRLLQRRAVPGHALPRYVLVDEYQDTTYAQAEMLRGLTAAHRNLTVAADPYQSIYSFRGARLENVVEFPESFRALDGSPGTRLVLTTSFRCPRAILESAVNVTARELPGAAGRVSPAPGEGRVDVHIFGQQTEEAEWVAGEIQRVHLTAGVPLRRMGVLVRTKRRFLPELSRVLERRGIAHDLPDSRLSDHPAVRFVLDLVAAAVDADDPAGRARAIRRVLLGPMYRLSLAELRLVEAAYHTSQSWIEALRGSPADELAALLAHCAWATDMPAADGAWHLWDHVDEAVSIVADPERRDERAAWRSLIQVLSRWNERNPLATLEDYRRLTEIEDFEAQPLLSFKRPETDRLVVTTLHQAKGLEFDTVFICDAVEGVLPDLRPRDSLLGVRHLMAHVPTDAAAYTAFRLQEERRLAYTAMTRASLRVVWTATSVGSEVGRGVPSRFLPLVAGVDTLRDAASPPLRDTTPVTPREAEALLSRTASDPAKSEPSRLAAVAALADGPLWGMRPPRRHHGVALRGSNTGLNGQVLRLSPSQADSYARCPRRYAIERRLDQAGDSIYARFGTLVHRVLDRVEAGALAGGANHSDYPTALRAFDELFDPAEYGGEPYAGAWRARAMDGLARLYNMWPSPALPIGVEVPVSLELGGVAWRGRVDRLEADDSGIRIVDYKTSKSPMSKEDAAVSLQLGFYALAVARMDEYADHGPPHAAAYWYPLKSAKRAVTTRELRFERLDEIAQLLSAIGDSIAAEVWRPNTGEWCERCPFASSCPARAEGGDQFS